MTQDGGDDWTILFYVDGRGREPVRDFLIGLDLRTQARFQWSIEQLRQRNTQAHEPLVRHLEGRIWELRRESNTNIYRLLYALVPGRRILFLHAFQKKTQRTSRERSRSLKAGWPTFWLVRGAEVMTEQTRRAAMSYEEWRKELWKNPEFQAIYEEEAAKSELWLQLVEARQAAGLTQAEVAHRLGVSQAQVARLEKRGYDSYTLNTLRRYVAALGEGYSVEVRIHRPDEERERATANA
jgi:phage-related protein/predicted XRE-type DNA-binding protein